ncbi:MAG: hypothetical protein WC100_01485 [Sterolibacterium sp.]
MEDFDEDKYGKETWGEGPWQHEPDNAEWVDPATGLQCLIKRNSQITGALCGYVGVPASSKLYGLDYWGRLNGWRKIARPVATKTKRDSKRRIKARDRHYGLLINGICVHGGLTFGDFWDEGGLWYFGFDCAHYRDYSPAIAATMRSLMPKSHTYSGSDEVYRDFAFVTEQTKALAAQLYQAGQSRG